MPEMAIPTAAIDALAEELYYDEDSDDTDVKWEDYRPDAEKMLREVVPHIVEAIAQKVEQGCPMPDAPPEHECGYRKPAAIVRASFETSFGEGDTGE